MATKKKPPKTTVSYVNVNRASKGYRDKYKKDVEIAVREFASKLGKAADGSDFTPNEWKRFFKTVLIPLDKDSEKKMIDLFINDREELNSLLILHNTRASDNLAEVYYKKYEKESPTHWHDLEDFKQMALEGLAIAAQRFDVNSGNKFITYATWWVLNRVRKPYQEKGAMIGHTSLSSPSCPFDSDNTATLEDVISPNMMAGDWDGMGTDEASTNPATILEKTQSDENFDFYSNIKHIVPESIDAIEGDKVKEMTKYLMGIVDMNKEYNDRQIFLYMFRKIFNKCSTLYPTTNHEHRVLNSYVNEAAKSKSELLSRIHMDEKQYKEECQNLMKRCYDGL